MCGIVGYVGPRQAAPVLMGGLRRLEYRGYDSAGVVIDKNNADLAVVKTAGRLDRLAAALELEPLPGNTGIGHTRWATHGRPNDVNAHPHTDCQGKIAVVHNGIIENYQELRERLEAEGHSFRSETDTEVIPHLIEDYYEGDLAAAVRRALQDVRGSYAVAVMHENHPGTIVAARQDSPLIIGLGQGENLLASDIPAVLDYTRDVLVMDDGDVAVLQAGAVSLTDLDGHPRSREPMHVQWDAAMAEKAGYPHFMLKEIHEQPRAIRDTLTGRLASIPVQVAQGATNGHQRLVRLEGVHMGAGELADVHSVQVIACGTAAHAGWVGKHVIEQLARIPVQVEVASEFRYRDPMVDEHTLGVVISQSGETADTLAGLREARRRGSRILAITNVVGSSVAREADDLIYTWAGPEIAVASTKAYVTQLVTLDLLALWMAERLGRLEPAQGLAVAKAIRELPRAVEQALALEPQVQALAQQIRHKEHIFFLGRGLDHALAMEGALKLKEISYIHAEAYAAGELKHGTLALVEEGTPVVALVTQPRLAEKMVSNIREVKARGAYVIVVAPESQELAGQEADAFLPIPETLDLVAPAVAVVPLQLLAYYAAVARGCDVDKPRNLAKSVTVE
ncbi:MAG: glutamine--fructose-6-phosphate transaminase (isomerizing) [Firmicutes bacterium]|nr:glutamine--fructose-6-phosphate transaminase (isomerizing) [Bacillota bacterium]